TGWSVWPKPRWSDHPGASRHPSSARRGICFPLTYNILMEQIGRLLVVMGSVLALVGFLLMLGPKLPFRLGRLPLDFHYQRDNFTFYFPLGTSILISVLLTLLFGLLNRR